MWRVKAFFCVIAFAGLGSTALATGLTAPTPTFTISASNVTMPSNGMVAIPFTLTSVNGFVGSITVDCSKGIVPGSLNLGPYCGGGGPVVAFPLTANGTATGNIEIVAIQPTIEPAVKAAGFLNRGHGASWALGGVLMLGLGLRRRARQFARIGVAAGVLGLAALGISGCSGPPTLTPGDYTFTLAATTISNSTQTPAIVMTTTATVTVPAGIVTNSSN